MPEQDDSSRRDVYIRASTDNPDEYVKTSDLVEQDRRNMEAEIPTTAIVEQDRISFHYDRPDGLVGKLDFEVKDIDWYGLSLSGDRFAPAPLLIGQLIGQELPNQIFGSQVTFAGSRFAGDIVQPNILATGRSVSFSGPEFGEYVTPTVNFLEIFRPDQDGHPKLVEPNQLATPDREISTKHQDRLNQLEGLMFALGFKFDVKNGRQLVNILENGQRKIDPLTPFYFDNGQVMAVYSAGMATGNELSILDRRTGQWVQIKYFNYNNDDILQIGIAMLDITTRDEFVTPQSVASTNNIYLDGESLVTYTTSGRYGIDVVNYHPSNTQTTDILGVPKLKTPGYEDDLVFPPDIQIWPGQKINVSRVNNNFHLMEKAYPGILQKIEERINATKRDNGDLNLNLNGIDVLLKNPASELEALNSKLHQSSVPPTSENFTNRFRRTVGRFLRNQ